MRRGDPRNHCLLNTRWHLWIRDKKVCALCHKKIEIFEDSSIDHIIPRSKGGPDHDSNYQSTHLWCNHQKGNLMPWQEKFFRFLNKAFFKVRSGRISKSPHLQESSLCDEGEDK